MSYVGDAPRARKSLVIKDLRTVAWEAEMECVRPVLISAIIT